MTVLLAALLLSAGGLPSDLQRYEETALELVLYNGWRAELKRHGVSVPVDFLGYAAAGMFAESVRAQEQLARFRALRVGGLVGVIGGVLLAGGALAVTLAAQGSWRLPAAYTLWTTSTAAISGGAGALIIAPLYLSRAVATYNEDMVVRW